jgi:hypothetical protein
MYMAFETLDYTLIISILMWKNAKFTRPREMQVRLSGNQMVGLNFGLGASSNAAYAPWCDSSNDTRT